MRPVCLPRRPAGEPVNPRLRRLEADYRDIRQRFDADENITVTPVGPLPPDQYQVTYRVPAPLLCPLPR